jgi:hypothetical protein
MPARTKIEPRPHSIMAAPDASEDETRLLLDAGAERLVLMAYELYAMSGDDLEKATRADVAAVWRKQASTLKFEKLALAPPLAAIAIIPPYPAGKREANLLLGLYVAGADCTVQYLAFYVNPAGAKDAPGATALAKKIAATIQPGPRKLLSKAGERRFLGIGKHELLVTVPEGFVASVQAGPDFMVYLLHKLVPLSQPAVNCSIYVGGHPAFQYRQVADPPEKVTRIKGKLLGKEAEWHTWSQDDRITTEAIVGHPTEQDAVVHVFCSGGSEEATTALRRMAETLRVAAPKKK